MIQDFLQQIKLTKSTNTWLTYKSALASYGQRDFTRVGLLGYIESQTGRSRSTVKLRLVAVGKYLKWAHMDNPDILAVISEYTTDEKLQPCPTAQEIADILDGITNPKYRAIFLLAAECGLRVSEITGIRMADHHEDHVVLRDTKNRKEYIVPLSTATQTAIATYLTRFTPHLWLFEGYSGRMDASGIQKHIKERMVAAGYGQYHMHSLRHYFCNCLDVANVSPIVIQRAMRHKSYQSTQRYLHMDDRRVMQEVGRVFG